MLENILARRGVSVKIRFTVKAAVSVGIVALAVLLPQLVHLALGQAGGTQWLPMYLPVLLGGCLLGTWWGLGVGLASPLVSFAITSAMGSAMPAAAPRFPVCSPKRSPKTAGWRFPPSFWRRFRAGRSFCSLP